MGRVTRRHPVLRIDGNRQLRRTDTLAVEEPLEIRLNGRSFSVTMRTPGDDVDLVHGFLHSEGVIRGAADVRAARYCVGAGPDGLNTYNVLDVTLAPGLEPPDGLTRNVVTTSACGICGTTSIDAVLRETRYPLDASTCPASTLWRAPDLLRRLQPTFDRTGGLHGAALVSYSGVVLRAAEDVGRHNAVDKVLGWALREGRLPLHETLLCVSGRASFELTQKAALAGVGLLAAVSAPSSLAVELAEATGLTLVGFLRGEAGNVYSHPERVETQPERTEWSAPGHAG